MPSAQIQGSDTYNYMANLPTTTSLGITSDGDASQLNKNFSGMSTYYQIISGGSSAGRAMGNRYMFETKARCIPGKYDSDGNYSKDVEMDPSKDNFGSYIGGELSELNDIGCNSDEVSYAKMDNNQNPTPIYTCPRSIYVETTQGGGPAGGLLGSAGMNIQKINPLKIANDVFAGSHPDCAFANLRIRECDGNGANCDDFQSAKAMLFTDDIADIYKCYFAKDQGSEPDWERLKANAIKDAQDKRDNVYSNTKYEEGVGGREGVEDGYTVKEASKMYQNIQSALEQKLQDIAQQESDYIESKYNIFNPSKPSDICTAADFAAMGICPGPGSSAAACTSARPVDSGTTGSGGGGGCPSGCVEGIDETYIINMPNSKIGKTYYIGLSVLALYILFKILYKKH